MIECLWREGSKTKTLTLRLDDELHKSFKLYSVTKGKDMQRILVEYIQQITEYENQQGEKKEK